MNSTTETAPTTGRRNASPDSPAPAASGTGGAASGRPAPTPWGRACAIGIALAAVVTLVVLAFSWPAVTSEPRDLPVAVAGPEQAVEQFEAALEQQGSDTLALTVVDDRDAAVSAIEHRDVYGAIVLGQSPEVLTSSAASTAASQMLTAVAGQLQAQLAQQAAAAAQAAAAQNPAAQNPAAAAQGASPQAAAAAPEVAVTDVVPLLDTDPRGTGLAAASFPLVLGGMLGGIAASVAIHGARRRAGALVVYSAAAGLAVAGVMQGWFQVLGGSYLANAAAFALSLLAIGSTIVGVATLIGRAGIAVGPVVFLLFANPISSANAPREFLPGAWGEIGQWFPPGAGATLIRDLSYFPDAPTAFPWAVLAVWSAAGLLLTAFAGLLHRRRTARA